MMRHMGDGMGDIPDPLGRAERAMHDAEGALQRGAPGEAITPQSQALDELQQVWRRMERRMRDARVIEVLANPALALDSKADFAEKAHLQPVYDALKALKIEAELWKAKNLK